jgi:hypothetical protein
MASHSSTAQRKRIIELKSVVAENFTNAHWRELAFLTSAEEIINKHPRLLRALSFGDDDYEPLILPILMRVVEADAANAEIIEKYINDNFDVTGENVSTAPSKGRRIVFSPSVFEVPDEGVDPQLVAVMMPFAAEYEAVFKAIKRACDMEDLTCVRVKDIWDHSVIMQDVFSLIFRARVVVCDFSGKNANVFYEAGIAHTLGKQVIPLSQSADDVPFDLKHHRYLPYLSNGEGLKDLTAKLQTRLAKLVPSTAGYQS